jgi:RNA polymerase sigma-70 factor, ECF subfamily
MGRSGVIRRGGNASSAGNKAPLVRADVAARERAEHVALGLIERGEIGAAITLLVGTYSEAVYAFCLRIIKDGAHAEDLRQRVFLQAYEALPSFAGGSSLRTWLLGIAKYRSLDALRALRREASRFLLDEVSLMEAVEGTTDPPESADLARATDALRACLEGCVSSDDRRLLMMRYRDGLSYEEMATALGHKPDTLRARVARVLPKLRRCLRRKGVEF